MKLYKVMVEFLQQTGVKGIVVIILCVILAIAVIALVIRCSILENKEKDSVDSYVKDNKGLLDAVRQRISECRSTAEFAVVKVWVEDKLKEISSTLTTLSPRTYYGFELGNDIKNEIIYLVSSKELELIKSEMNRQETVYKEE